MGVVVKAIPRFAPPEPVRVVLKSTRPLVVRVADAAGKLVEGAAVEVAVEPWQAVDPGVTDGHGVARFQLPADARFRGVLALKEGLGADCFAKDPPPAEVALTLAGARTMTIKAVDSADRPVPGVPIFMDSLTRWDRQPGAHFLARISRATTDASGIVRWDWFPRNCAANFWVDPVGNLTAVYPPRFSGTLDGDVSLTVRLQHQARLSGRVVNADGSPARGVEVKAGGWGRSRGLRLEETRTGADGSYTMAVAPDVSYVVAVAGPDLAAKPIPGVAVAEGAARRARFPTDRGDPAAWPGRDPGPGMRRA